VRGGNTSPTQFDILAAILRAKGVDALRVPETFPLQTADSMRALGFDVAAVPGQFFPERAVKRKDELEAIQFAQGATERAVEEAMDVLRESRPRGGYLVAKGERVTSES